MICDFIIEWVFLKSVSVICLEPGSKEDKIMESHNIEKLKQIHRMEDGYKRHPVPLCHIIYDGSFVLDGPFEVKVLIRVQNQLNFLTIVWTSLVVLQQV